MKLGETRSFWSLQGLSNAVENGGHLGSTADERLASLNLVNVSPKEGVGGSSPSEAANLNLELCMLNALRTVEGVTPSANERAILHRGELIDGDEFALLSR